MPKHPHRDHDAEWTVEKILKAMERPAYPEFLLELVAQIQEWMETTLSGETISPGDEAFFSYGDRIFQGDMDGLAGRLEWLESKADLLPSAEDPQGHEEAVVLCLGPIDFEEGMRIAVQANKRSLRYVEAILRSWQEKGRDEKDRRDPEKDRRRFIEGEYSDFIEH